MYTAMQIAQYVIDKCTIEEYAISNLQLQKILFYLQKAALNKSINNPIFCEDFVAWQFGPVIEEVYYNYCGFGSMPIRRKYETVIDNVTKMMIDPIIEMKRILNPWDMVTETHKKGGAWDYVYYNVGNGGMITKTMIAEKG